MMLHSSSAAELFAIDIAISIALPCDMNVSLMNLSAMKLKCLNNEVFSKYSFKNRDTSYAT